MISSQTKKFFSHGSVGGGRSSDVVAETAWTHFTLHNKMTEASKLDHRRLDQYVLVAFWRVGLSYFRHITRLKRRSPLFMLKVDEVEIGKHACSSALRKPKTNKTVLVFWLRFHVSLLRGVFVLGAAYRNKRSISAICLGNISYLDGIVIDYALQRKHTWVYISLPDPDDLLLVKGVFDNISALQAHLRKSRKGVGSKSDAISLMKNRLSDPDSEIYYYDPGPKSQGVETLIGSRATTVVVYAHSFTDAQLIYGQDGFSGVYQWLKFTTNELSSKLDEGVRIVIKAHPNFFGEAGSSGIPALDLDTWNHFCQALDPRFEILNKPISNLNLLRNFDPANTILVSHHGNAIVEGAYLGFRSVSSAASPWGETFSFSQTWSNIAGYREILKSIEKQIRPLSPAEFTSVIDFVNKNYVGHQPWIQAVSDHLGAPVKKVISEWGTESAIKSSRNEKLIKTLLGLLKEVS